MWIALLTFACSTAERPPTPPPAPAPAASADGCEWRMEGGVLAHEMLEGREPATTREVDLDGQGPPDLVAFLHGCGNHGECEHVVLQACEGGGYREVWGPDYAMSLDVAARAEGAPLADLHLGGRLVQDTCDQPVRTTLTWADGRWRESGVCASGAGVWDDGCGAPPPPCPRGG